MYNKKSLSIIFLFGCIFIFVVYIAITTKKRNLNKAELGAAKTVERSSFKEVHYFKLENLRPSFELKSEVLDITNNVYLEFIKPRGQFFGKDSQINYTAQSGFLDKNQNVRKLHLKGDVHLSNANSDYVSDELVYDQRKELLVAKGNVSSQTIDEKTQDIIRIKSNKLTSYLARELSILEGKVRGRIIRKRRYEPGLKFSSEKAQLNSLKSQLDLVKSVKIHRNNYYLQAGKAEIFLENYNKKLKYYTLYDDVKLEEKLQLESGKSQTRRAYAEKLEGHRRTGKVILTGAPRVEQGSDVIKGYQITLRENVQLVEVDDAQSSFSIKRNKND